MNLEVHHVEAAVDFTVAVKVSISTTVVAVRLKHVISYTENCSNVQVKFRDFFLRTHISVIFYFIFFLPRLTVS